MRRRPPREVPGGDPALRDPYAAALERARERKAAEEAIERITVPRRRNVLPKALLFAGLLGVIVVVGGQLINPTPELAPDCATTRLVLGSAELRGAGAVKFGLTGPETDRYVVAVDAESLRRDGERYLSDPAPGTLGGFRAVSREIVPKGCVASGQLTLDDRPGVRTLVVFDVSGGQPRPVASATAEVLPPL